MTITLKDFALEFDEFQTQAPFGVLLATAYRASLRTLPFLALSDFAYSPEISSKVLLSLCRGHLSMAAYLNDPSRIRRETLEKALAHMTRESSAGPVTDLAETVKLLVGEAQPRPKLSSIIGRAVFLARERMESARADRDFLEHLKFGDLTEVASKAFEVPLWLERPKELDSLLGNLWFGGQGAWHFWQNWYASIMIGEQLHGSLLGKISDIKESIWEAGPEAVAEEIARIEADFLANRTALAERVELSDETGLFRTVPIDLQNSNLIGSTLDQVADALDDTLSNPSNGLTDRSREAKVIRRTVERYGNNPQRIEMDLTGVAGSITRQVAVGDLPPSEENIALQAACEEGARAIRATHPDVAENRKLLNAQAMGALSHTDKAKLEEALPILEAMSEQPLAQEWREDVEVLREEGNGPPRLETGKRNSILASYAEKQRVFSRAAKIAIILRSPVVVIDVIAQRTGMSREGIIQILLGLVGIGIALLPA